MVLMLPTARSLPLLVTILLSGWAIGATAVRLESRDTANPPPISIQPSYDWEGNDGPWSSFAVQIGTPPQTVRVFVSTASTQTWAVATVGCGTGDPTTCSKLRGGIYDETASSTWVSNLANISSNIYGLGLESDLGYVGNGRYGFDDITLGFLGGGGPTLKNQTVAGIAAKEFFLGSFGLSPRSSNFTNYHNPIPSFMENLKKASKIPSLSWAYTAGNQYRTNEIPGSLTLGGYDSSKFIPNDVTFPLSTLDYGTELAVKINTITTGSTSLLPTPITAFLDSTIPYIYLPTEACALFESQFGLVYNETSKLYILNNTQHLRLQAQNASITFTLSPPSSQEGSKGVEITFPYGAFDLHAQWPLVNTDSFYFPLRRAENEKQYVLGRTFFQEAYITADYERSNFSVSACKWDASPQTLVPIRSPTTSSAKLATGIIVGIAVGAGLLVLGIILFFFFVYKPRHRKQKAAELAAYEAIPQNQNQNQDQTQNATVIRDPQTGEYIKPELDSNEIHLHPQRPGQVVYEADGKKLAIQPVYEMPAREEVALEMTGWSRPPELGVRHGEEPMDRQNRRWSWLSRGNASRSPSEAAFEMGRGGAGSQSGGGSHRGGPRERGLYGPGPGEDTMSSISSGMGTAIITPDTLGSPRSSPRSGIVSPATPEQFFHQQNGRFGHLGNR